MKVTALLPDDLIHEVQDFAQGKNLSNSLIIALKEWTSIQKLKFLNDQIRKTPLEFKKQYSAQKIRALNRQA